MLNRIDFSHGSRSVFAISQVERIMAHEVAGTSTDSPGAQWKLGTLAIGASRTPRIYNIKIADVCSFSSDPAKFGKKSTRFVYAHSYAAKIRMY